VQGNNPRSISFDIQTTITTSTVIIWTGTTASYGAFAIDLNFGSAKGIIQVDGYTGAYTPTTGRIVNDGQWHSILVTYDGTTAKIYVDGFLDNSATNWNYDYTSRISSTLNTKGNSNYLSGYSGGYSFQFIGRLRNVQFYNYALVNTDFITE